MDNTIIGAARIASNAHYGQTRSGGESYINHPMRVAHTTMMVQGIDPEIVAAAWLHDVVEDTSMALVDIRFVFGNVVADLVYDMTNMYTSKAYPNMKRKERKERECVRLAHTNSWAVHTIKLADRYDNLYDLLNRDRKWAKKYLRESMALHAALTLGDQRLRERLKCRIDELGEIL